MQRSHKFEVPNFRKMQFSISALLFIAALEAAVAQNVGDDLKQPTIFESENGLLDIILTLEYADHATAAHSFTDTRLFNGTFPGPMLKVKAGDKMKILFKNQLVDQGHEYEENTFSHPDTSNLHFHGAHVSGKLPSDDVTYNVEPQDEFQYETDFPFDHMPGTHWIHPHVHGSGSLQVGGGAAMALIVEDPVGTLPTEAENAEDVLLFVQHMDINQLENVAADSSDGYLNINNNNIHGRNYRLVNGQFQPTVHMQPGEWQRWRVVYASWLRDALDFTIVNNECEMQLLAKDGFTFKVFHEPSPWL
jgi:FtsP/CotA-like multicopper oxidase with cupredoxin domain